MTASSTNMSTFYNGNAVFCDLACAAQVGCLYFLKIGTSCYLHNLAQSFVPDSTSKIYISNSAYPSFNSTLYVQFTGVRFTASLISSYAMVTSGCRVICNQMPSCISFTTESANGNNNCDFAASSLNPILNANKIGNLLAKPAQSYYDHASVNYIGSNILTIAGSISYCSQACDALSNCVGYVYDSSMMCNFKSMMNVTNYVRDATVVSKMLSLVDLTAVNNAIGFPAVPGMALKYLGCYIQGTPSILTSSVSTVG